MPEQVIDITQSEISLTLETEQQDIIIVGGGGSSASVTPSDDPPLMNASVASAGDVLPYSRGNHVHPTDTSRAPVDSPAFTGDVSFAGSAIFNDETTLGAQTYVEGQASSPLQTLTDGATISAWDCSQGQKAKVTLGAAGRTMAAPTGVVEGTTYFLWVIQDATGNRTITTWNAAFDFGAAGTPTLSTTGNKADLLTFEAINIASALKMRFTGIAKGFG